MNDHENGWSDGGPLHEADVERLDARLAMPARSTQGVQDVCALNRHHFLRLMAASAAALALPAAAQPTRTAMTTRPIPSTREPLPLIGCGTYVGFDVARGSADYERLPAVLQALFDAGGSVIDSSPMYGRAEEVTGALLAAAQSRQKAFIATKVWTQGKAAGIAQMERSMKLLQTDTIDLMQVHNLLDVHTHLATLRDWKAQKKVRYIGVTHYTSSAYDQLEAVMRAEKPDFVQLNYSLDDRAAERRLLPLAHDLGIAVLVNRPFGGGGLLSSLKDRPLPDFAADLGARSWPQLLLKYVLGHPAVTCAIPGTGRPQHMADNAAAAMGPLPDARMRERMVAAWKG